MVNYVRVSGAGLRPNSMLRGLNYVLIIYSIMQYNCSTIVKAGIGLATDFTGD